MRIAFVVHDYHRQGGHSRYCSELAERFAREHEVHVFANRFAEGLPLAPPSALPGGRLFLQRVPAWRKSALGTVLSFYEPASRAVQRLGPFDIVHAQGFACRGSNLLTAHICCAAWHAQRVASGHRLDWKERVFDAVVMRLEEGLYGGDAQRRVIAISDRVKQDLAHFCHREGNVTVIPHGVDEREFDLGQAAAFRREIRNRHGWREDQFVALWVGDLRKGAEAALAAVAANPGQTFAAVSRNETAYYEQKTLALGAGGRAHFLPPTKEIAKYYAAADVFLFPTTYDAFGMVVLEAMAMGTPVVVSKSAGAAELIEHGVDGLLLENPFAVEESAAWLRQLEADLAFRKRLGQAAAATAASHSWDRVAARTLEVYRQVLAEAGRRERAG